MAWHRWNWQQEDWPHFQWNADALIAQETQFLQQSGILIGAAHHMNEDDQARLVIDLITDEALKTSEIEGEYLSRDSVQASILRNFGFETDHRRVEPSERGIADLMTDLYKNFDKPLSHAMLYRWHKMISNGRTDLKDIGRYRRASEPMQVVSGYIGNPTVHFEAPPSDAVKPEMDRFVTWFKDTAPEGKQPLPAITRAGIAHLYFVSIHPFEDGNGRIGRALAEKALSECLGAPTLTALSHTIQDNRKAYYAALEKNNKSNSVEDWMSYFSKTVLNAQSHSLDVVKFLIEKAKFYDNAKGRINDRQEKAIARIFQEGVGGFKGGLSAKNYITITGAFRATATRDLQDLVEKGLFVKKGKLKSTRYFPNLERYNPEKEIEARQSGPLFRIP
ncbi:MAG: Fic family protein [Geminicoccaceae bacterium]